MLLYAYYLMYLQVVYIYTFIFLCDFSNIRIQVRQNMKFSFADDKIFPFETSLLRTNPILTLTRIVYVHF